MIPLLILGFFGILWLLLSVLAQTEKKEASWIIGETGKGKQALIVYNPDLFYNLDEQICKAVARGLSEENWSSQVATIAAARKQRGANFDLYVFCANTYNWAPDKPTMKYLKEHPNLQGKHVVAITLGSGSTARAERLLEEALIEKGAMLLDSNVFWLMRPNDESTEGISNVAMATTKAAIWGKELALRIETIH